MAISSKPLLARLGLRGPISGLPVARQGHRMPQVRVVNRERQVFSVQTVNVQLMIVFHHCRIC